MQAVYVPNLQEKILTLSSFQRQCPYMPVHLKAQEGEPTDRLLRRFKKAVDRSGVLAEAKDRRYYDKPCVVKRRQNNENAFRTMLRQRRSF